jgi:MFS family permease
VTGARRRGRITLLATGETLVWASIYYAFPALLPHWERSLGWSKATLTGAFTVALLISAVCAPLVGRLIDRGHGAAVLSGSALAGGLLMGALTQVEQIWQFYLLWSAMGVVMSGALYEACFAHLTHVFGAQAKRSITSVALVAGFAGTVAFPAAHFLAEAFGWRGAVLGFAVGAGALASPLLWLGAQLGPGQAAVLDLRRAGQPSEPLARALRTPVFWLLAASFAMIALDHGILITHLLPLLAERGVESGTAVLAASLIGPMQVVGRIVMLSVESRVSIGAVCAASHVFVALAAGALFGVYWLPLLVFAFVLFQGSGYGVTSIVRPLVTAEFLGREGFGAISGAQATAVMSAFAIAPTIASLLWEVGDYDLVIGACLVFSGCGFACFLAAARVRRREAGA